MTKFESQRNDEETGAENNRQNSGEEHDETSDNRSEGEWKADVLRKAKAILTSFRGGASKRR
jgi:hypothetical protein